MRFPSLAAFASSTGHSGSPELDVQLVADHSVPVLVTVSHRDVNGMVSPCGICRQVLREFCPLEVSSDTRSLLSFPLGIKVAPGGSALNLYAADVRSMQMPVLLVPASYVEGKTRTVTAAEAEHGSTEDTLVATTMGEVRLFAHPTHTRDFVPSWLSIRRSEKRGLTSFEKLARSHAVATPAFVRSGRPRETETRFRRGDCGTGERDRPRCDGGSVASAPGRPGETACP